MKKNRAAQDRRAELEQERRKAVVVQLFREYQQLPSGKAENARQRKRLLQAIKERTNERDDSAALAAARDAAARSIADAAPSNLLPDGSIPAAHLTPRPRRSEVGGVRSMTVNNVGRGKRQ